MQKSVYLFTKITIFSWLFSSPYKLVNRVLLATIRMAFKASNIQWSSRCDGKIGAGSVDIVAMAMVQPPSGLDAHHPYRTGQVQHATVQASVQAKFSMPSTRSQDVVTFCKGAVDYPRQSWIWLSNG